MNLSKLPKLATIAFSSAESDVGVLWPSGLIVAKYILWFKNPPPLFWNAKDVSGSAPRLDSEDISPSMVLLLLSSIAAAIFSRAAFIFFV